MKRIAPLIWKEFVYRKMNTVLAVVGVTAAVAICVAISILSEASNRETRRIQRDIGFNLRIIPRDTDMTRFYTTGFSQHTFPEASARSLAERETLSFNHIVPTLAQQITIGSTKGVILTGIGDPLYPSGRKKGPMVRPVAPGTVHVGFEIARSLNVRQGETVELEGKQFTVARVAPETGSIDDLRVIGHLADIQHVLNQVGRINEISAIDCLCLTADKDPHAILRSEIESVIPEAKVIMLTSIAEARARQRQMMERFGSFVTPLVVMVAAAWIAVLAMMNVKARTSEIGVFRAIGFSAGQVGKLFLGKAIIIGILGALIGYGIGALTATFAGPDLFELTAKSISVQPSLLAWAVLSAPLGTAVASFIPAALAMTQDPAVTLMVE